MCVCVCVCVQRERVPYISLIKPNGVDVRCENVQICAFASFKACCLVHQKAKHLLRFRGKVRSECMWERMTWWPHLFPSFGRWQWRQELVCRRAVFYVATLIRIAADLYPNPIKSTMLKRLSEYSPHTHPRTMVALHSTSFWSSNSSAAVITPTMAPLCTAASDKKSSFEIKDL